MPALADTQRLLWQLITAPEGVAAALAADRERGGGILADALARTVCGSGALDATARLDIYANMYFFRILDVLRDDFPGLTAVLGDTAFHNLATDYLLACPPRSFSIRHVGDRLPSFIATHPARTARPYLEDLARFEAAVNDGFDAADACVQTAADLAAVPAADWGRLRLLWHPSLQLLRCGWAVHELRAAVDRGGFPDPPDREETRLCVWRRGFEVRHRAVDPFEFVAMSSVTDGATFGAICAAVAEREPDAPPRLAAVVGRWIADGCIAGYNLAP